VIDAGTVATQRMVVGRRGRQPFDRDEHPSMTRGSSARTPSAETGSVTLPVPEVCSTLDAECGMSPRMAHTNTAVDLDIRRREPTDQIGALGPTLPGSLVSRSNRCGNRYERCHTDPAQRNGPYWAWTRSVGGKTITRALSDEQAER
jgi:hypothetical protein